MANAPAVSVIIPMFNAEKYIAECLDSVLAQTFQDFEVIIVNDCATDGSRQIAESYLEKFGGRLKIYDNESNLGISSTRNNGLLRAQGEYVFFMDDDDLILASALEELYGKAKHFNVDVVNFTEAYSMSEDGKEVTRKFSVGKIKGKYLLESNMEWRIKNFLLHDRFGWAPWRKMSRREFLLENKIFFPVKLKRVEDVMWTHALLFFAKKIIHVPRAVYFHRSSLVSESVTMSRLERINFRAGALVHAMEWIDKIMDRAPFFEKNPKYRYPILKHIAKRFFKIVTHIDSHISPRDMYDSLREEFKENSDGCNASVAVPVLFTLINEYQRKLAKHKPEKHLVSTQEQLVGFDKN
ncbi:MAG: glycosyltransferase [Selenomonadaceae bacterium]|nr:glycosyltransferase [Selenomonadaceae bacterium]